MRYVILVLLLAGFACPQEHNASKHYELMEPGGFPLSYGGPTAGNLTSPSFNVKSWRPKRSVGKLSLRHVKKNQRRKAERLKLKRYLRKQLRNAEKARTLLHRKDTLDTKRLLREDDSMSSNQATKESQNELLASVDDLPKQNTTVEISFKDPGLCKVDGVPMCKRGGECMSRVSGYSFKMSTFFFPLFTGLFQRFALGYLAIRFLCNFIIAKIRPILTLLGMRTFILI